MINPTICQCERCNAMFFREIDDISDLCYKCQDYLDWQSEWITDLTKESEDLNLGEN